VFFVSLLILNWFILDLSVSATGIYLSGDYTISEIFYKSFWEIINLGWEDKPFLGGVYEFEQGTTLYNTLTFLIVSLFNLSIESFQRVEIILIISLAQFGMFRWLNSLKVKKKHSVVFAIIYGLSPFFYNYIVFGWIYIALGIAAIPYVMDFTYRYINKNLTLIQVLPRLSVCGAAIFTSVIYLPTLILVFSYFIVALTQNLALGNKDKGVKYLIPRYIFINLALISTNLIWIISRFFYPIDDLVTKNSSSVGQEEVMKWHTGMTGFGLTFNNSAESNSSQFYQYLTYFFVALTLILIFYKLIEAIIINKRLQNFSVIIFCLSLILIGIVITQEYVRISLIFDRLGIPYRDSSRLLILSYFGLVTIYGVLTRIIQNNLAKTTYTLLAIVVTLLGPFLSPGIEPKDFIPAQPALSIRTQKINQELFIVRDFLQKSNANRVFWVPYDSFLVGEKSEFFKPPFHSYVNYEPLLMGLPSVFPEVLIGKYARNFSESALNEFKNGPIEKKAKIIDEILDVYEIEYVITSNYYVSQNDLALLSYLQRLNKIKILEVPVGGGQYSIYRVSNYDTKQIDINEGRSSKVQVLSSSNDLNKYDTYYSIQENIENIENIMMGVPFRLDNNLKISGKLITKIGEFPVVVEKIKDQEGLQIKSGKLLVYQYVKIKFDEQHQNLFKCAEKCILKISYDHVAHIWSVLNLVNLFIFLMICIFIPVISNLRTVISKTSGSNR